MSIYSDINSYHDTDDKDKTIKKNVIENEASVYQSINNILSTTPGERLFNPEFGSDMGDMVFELNDDETELIIFDTILKAIKRFDSRIKIDMTETDLKRDLESNKLELTLSFEIEGLDDQKFEHSGIIEL